MVEVTALGPVKEENVVWFENTEGVEIVDANMVDPRREEKRVVSECKVET